MHRILVTGAQGMLGRAVVNAALERGMQVRAWEHRPETNAPDGIEWITGDICDVVLADTATKNIDVVLHLAARKRDEADSHDVNVDGSRIVAEAARRNNVQFFVYVSTQSVKLKERGTYAQTKLDGEEAVRSVFPGATIVRPSLLYGDTLDGLMSALINAAALPLTPVFGSGAAVFRPMHVDDLARALVTIVENNTEQGRVMDAGGSEEVTFVQLLTMVGSIAGATTRILRLPVWLGLGIATLLSPLPHPPITRSNVIGGSEIVPMNIADFQTIGHPPTRSLREALASAWERTKSGQEPSLILRFIGARPTEELTKRYRAACSVHGVEESITSSSILLWLQDAWTRIYDSNGVLQKKLLIAAAVYEADPASADALLPRDQSLVAVIIRTFIIGVTGIMLFVFCHLLFLFPVKRRHGL